MNDPWEDITIFEYFAGFQGNTRLNCRHDCAGKKPVETTDTLAGQKLCLLSLRTANPFPLESFCQHDSGQISTPEKLLYIISLLTLKRGDNLTVPHLPRKMDMINRSGTDCKS